MIPVSSAFQAGVYANVRQFNSQLYFTCAQLNGGARTLYTDSRIINFDLVEETTTLNDSVPSDQLTIELDNTDGAFNFLNISNMQTIIAGRPKIELQLGLSEGWRYIRWTGYGDNTGAITRLIEIKAVDALGNNLIAGQAPLSYTATSGGAPISAITDGVTTSASGNYPYWNATGCQVVFDLGALNTQLKAIDAWMYSAVGDLRDTKFKIEVSQDNVNWTTVSDMSANTTQTQDPVTGWVLPVPVNDEFLNMGTFYVDSWKNQVKSVILTAHDNLMFLDNVAYVAPTPSSRSLQAIAQDIFSQAGITNYQLDPVLATITSNGFKQASATNSSTLTCRQALQHLAIASQCTVYQDRNGVMQIKSFGTLDSASLYSNYPVSTTMGTGLASLWGYPVNNTASSSSPPTPISSNFVNENTAGGMRYLGLAQMFDLPIITLEASVYQLSINVYDVNFNTTPQVFTNSAVSAGSNGQSFTIDNPLINTVAQATAVANWFIGEANYNAVYQANWRGNPCLTPTDVVIVENGRPDGNGGVIVDTIKQSRIYRNEFNYTGYLTATTQARGGL
jgi:hypothetical protein